MSANNILMTGRSRSALVPNWKYDHHHRRPSSSVVSRRSPAHFFKIILPSSMADKKLRIPKKFVKLFGYELASVVTLTLPNGCSWQVGLEKAEKKIWFHEGWHDFVEHHFIDNGYFLVFRYEGNSTFHLLVFDKTATEIQYPSRKADDEMDIMVLDDEEKSSHEKLQGNEMSNKVVLSIKHEDAETFDCERVSDTSEKQRFRICRGRERAIQAARTLKPKNPSFVRFLRPHNIRKSFMFFAMQYVPAKFAAKYLSLNQSVKLQTSDNGRQWHAMCCYHNKTSSSMKIAKGWSAFVRGNNLKEGDAFVFELINMMPTVLKVSIFRVADYV
ncbi:B3 domain-containing transcription factor VRN1-like isoform X1 [Carya illinoinensis]|uniref:B3 domain-containing transcription factor VRN1-like isoform X1 n=2 Tax=Carya illinoinensis TaxID=32201 RepID=UPI001C723040|nr:B3 domain-containing transcription factor VRN1-like isoform X1 [Carya illinoinensis]